MNIWFNKNAYTSPLVEIKALIMLEHSGEQVSEPFKIEPIQSDFYFVLWHRTMRQKPPWIRIKTLILAQKIIYKFSVSLKILREILRAREETATSINQN